MLETCDCPGLTNLKFAEAYLQYATRPVKLIFEAGDLVAAEIVPAPMEPGPKARWIVQVKRKNGVRVALKLNRKAPGGNDQVRVFNSLDAAYSAARSVGFRAAMVQE